MANRTTQNVSLTPALTRFIRAEVASGRYQSASEVVRAALRLLVEQEQDKTTTRQQRPDDDHGSERARLG